MHIITGLDTGGAEMMLCKLVSQMQREGHEAEVISLTSPGTVAGQLQALGTTVRALGMKRGVPNPVLFVKLVYWLRCTRPDIIQTWMYHADLIGGLAGRLARDIPVVWGIRNSDLDPVTTASSTRLTVKLCAMLSASLPRRIICCSEVSQRVHVASGYRAEQMLVVPNGFDVSVFSPDHAARQSVRKELHIPQDAVCIGLVGRFHPQKDHQNFIRAAAMLHARRPDVHFIICGAGLSQENSMVMEWISTAGRADHYHLLGPRADIPRLTAAFDIATSSSAFGEAFPNIIGEAMACGVPCAVTDVGDSGLIVGDTGRIVPPENPEALAAAWLALIDMGAQGRSQLGAAARRRVEENFSLSGVAAHYQEIYQQVLTDVRH